MILQVVVGFEDESSFPAENMSPMKFENEFRTIKLTLLPMTTLSFEKTFGFTFRCTVVQWYKLVSLQRGALQSWIIIYFFSYYIWEILPLKEKHTQKIFLQQSAQVFCRGFLVLFFRICRNQPREPFKRGWRDPIKIATFFRCIY